jgi:hypothetical protein
MFPVSCRSGAKRGESGPPEDERTQPVMMGGKGDVLNRIEKWEHLQRQNLVYLAVAY